MRLIDADKLCEGRVSNDPVRIAAMCEPTVDAVPVKRGKWTPVKYNAHCSCGKSYGTYHYLCSACNHVSYSQPYGLSYCPNCGADMREVSE